MKVYFDTLGCQKNFNDSDIAMGILESSGHVIANSADEADVIIVNTCGFIDDAKRESIDEIFKMSEYRNEGKKLIVSGCLVQRYISELYDEMPEVDGFSGVNDYDKLPVILDDISRKANRVKSVKSYDPMNYITIAESRRIPDNPYSAYIRIAEGCDNACAYCAIPKIRGPYRSRTKESILSEAEKLAKASCKELVIIAQDTGCYGKDIYGEIELPDLLRKLCKVDGIEWIRLMYCYEENITDELIEVMANEPKICHYIDIPLQHVSNSILKSMNRSTSKESIMETITKLRTAMPDICIRTTMLVGFPGETENDYGQLIDFIEETRFDRLGAFAYSKEEGTVAAEMEDQIDDEIKQIRLDGVMMRQLEISLEHNQSLVGQELKVIVDEEDEGGAYIGRTIYDAPEIDNSVIFEAKTEHKPGDFVTVKILEAYDYDLQAVEV